LISVEGGGDAGVAVAEVAGGGKNTFLTGDDATNFLAQLVDGFERIDAIFAEP